MEEEIFDDITKTFYKNKYEMYHTNKHSFVEEERLAYDKNFIPKIFDGNIFNCDLTEIAKRSNVVKLKELGNHSVVTLKDIYCNPFAVRNFISEVPHCLNNQSDPSHYPGYVAKLDKIPLHDLEIIITKLILLYYRYLDINTSKFNLNIKFSSALYHSKNITYENTPIIMHRDSTSKYIMAGLIYMNTEEECDGGTSFHKEDGELVYLNKMKFNSLVLYPAKMMHSIYVNDLKKSFRNNYRITQRIFLDLPNSE